MATCILIHGTWGEKSDFAHGNSLFAKALSGSLQGGLQFRRFDWSGRNSTLARLEATEALASMIARSPVSEQPLFLIAHSHGGNVAVAALQRKETQGRVAGLVTLGTPFLSETPRKLAEDFDEDPLFHFVVFVVFHAVLALSIVGLVGSIIGLFSPWYGLASAGFLGIALFNAACNPSNAMAWLVDRIADASSRALASSNSGAKLDTPLLVLHSKADEAIWWLRQLFGLTRIPHTMLRAAFWVAVRGLGVAACLYFFHQLLQLISPSDEATVFGKWAVYTLFGVLVGVIGTLAVALIGVIANRLAGTGERLHSLDEFFVNTVVSARPKIECAYLQELRVPLSDLHGGLWHSKYLRSGFVVDAIAAQLSAWISVGGGSRG